MEQTLDQFKTTEGGFDLGTWVGRHQAFRLVAGRCSAAFIECLSGIKEKKLYLAMTDTWEDFCAGHLGISRATADRIIRQHQKLGAPYSKLNSFVPIRPSEYRLIAEAVTEDGLSFDGEIIPLDSENVPKLAQAVETLRREAAPAPDPVDPAEQAFAKAEKSLEAAIAAFARLQEMNLDQEGRLRLVIAVEGGRDHLDRIRITTSLE